MSKQLGSALDIPQVATPSTNPAASRQLLYVKSDGNVYTKNSAGTEVMVNMALGTTSTTAATGDHTHMGAVTDWNTFPSSSAMLYNSINPSTNQPENGWWVGTVEWQQGSTVYVTQTLHDALETSATTDPHVWRRIRTAGVWGSWYRVKVGTTGLGASGTPSNVTYLRGDNTWAIPPTYPSNPLPITALQTQSIDYNPPGSGDIAVGVSFNMAGNYIYGVHTPTNTDHALTKGYLDGLALKIPCRVATTANIAALSGLIAVDTVANVAAGDRILVKNQTATAANGIYVAASGAWARSQDCNTALLMASAAVTVNEGTWTGRIFQNKFKSTDTLGTTGIDWWYLMDNLAGSFAYASQPTGTPDGTKFYRDDNTWAVPASGGGGGGSTTPPLITIFTANGTWIKPTGCSYATVEVVGGGGGSGGIGAGVAGQHACSGGGGGGGYVKRTFTASALGATEPVVIGAGGTAGAATPTNAGNGGNTTFSSGANLLTGSGGAGTILVNSSSAASFGITGGLGGTAAGGDVNIPGDGGMYGYGDATYATSGIGGSTPLGVGGFNRVGASSGLSLAGTPPVSGYGGGAGGAVNTAAGAAAAGAAGAGGAVIVTAYFGSGSSGGVGGTTTTVTMRRTTTAGQIIQDASTTGIGYANVVDDIGGIVYTAAPTTPFAGTWTIPATGTYVLTMGCQFVPAAPSAAQVRRAVIIQVNGTTCAQEDNHVSASASVSVTTATTRYLTAGDTVVFCAYQTSGGTTLNLSTAGVANYASIAKVDGVKGDPGAPGNATVVPAITMRRTASVAQNTLTSTNTTVLYDVAQDDSGGIIYNTGTGEWTVPQAGTYLMAASLRWTAVATASSRTIAVQVNGVSIAQEDTQNSYSGVTTPSVSTTRVLAAGDKVNFAGWQNTGSNLNMVVGGAMFNWASVSRVDGVQGLQGPAGGVVLVQDEGTPVGTPNTINFTGPGMSASIDGGGVSTVNVNDYAGQQVWFEDFHDPGLKDWQQGPAAVASGNWKIVGGAGDSVGPTVFQANDTYTPCYSNLRIPYDSNLMYRMRVRVRNTAGSANFYAGVRAYDYLGNPVLGTLPSGNCYFAVQASPQTPPNAWTEYVGYLRGYSTNGASTGTLVAPGSLPTNTCTFAPMMLPAYGAVAGNVQLVSMMKIEALPQFIEVWTGLTMANGWVAYGAGFVGPQYTIDADGWVTVRGMIKSGTVSAGITVATGLPVPAAGNEIFSASSANAFALMQINTTGALSLPVVGSATWVSLSGMRYRTT